MQITYQANRRPRANACRSRPIRGSGRIRSCHIQRMTSQPSSRILSSRSFSVISTSSAVCPVLRNSSPYLPAEALPRTLTSRVQQGDRAARRTDAGPSGLVREHLGDLGTVDPGQREVTGSNSLCQRKCATQVHHGSCQSGGPESAQLDHLGVPQRHPVDLHPTTGAAPTVSIPREMHATQVFPPDRKLVQCGGRRMTDHSFWAALRHGGLQQLEVRNSWIRLTVRGLGVRTPTDVHQFADPGHPGQLPRGVPSCRQVGAQRDA